MAISEETRCKCGAVCSWSGCSLLLLPEESVRVVCGAGAAGKLLLRMVRYRKKESWCHIEKLQMVSRSHIFRSIEMKSSSSTK